MLEQSSKVVNPDLTQMVTYEPGQKLGMQPTFRITCKYVDLIAQILMILDLCVSIFLMMQLLACFITWCKDCKQFSVPFCCCMSPSKRF